MTVPRDADEEEGRGLDVQASDETTNQRWRRIPDQTRAARVDEGLGAAALEVFQEGVRRNEI